MGIEHSVASLSLCVFVSVDASKGKRLDLSTPKSVGIYSTAGPNNVLTLRSKSQSYGQDYGQG